MSGAKFSLSANLLKVDEFLAKIASERFLKREMGCVLSGCFRRSNRFAGYISTVQNQTRYFSGE